VREQKRWTSNPYLAMVSYRHVLLLLQLPGWEVCFMMIQEWMIKFKICELEPKPTEQEIRNREDALSALFG
jgi:hypothetical protein